MADELADASPRHPAEVHQTRRCRRSCGENAGTPAPVQPRVIAVRNRSASPTRIWSRATKRVGIERGRLGRREQRVAMEMRSNWPELARVDLKFGVLIEHTPTGAFYRVMRGEVYGAGNDPVDAYFVNADGDAVFLQRPVKGSPQTRAELEERPSRLRLNRITTLMRGHPS